MFGELRLNRRRAIQLGVAWLYHNGVADNPTRKPEKIEEDLVLSVPKSPELPPEIDVFEQPKLVEVVESAGISNAEPLRLQTLFDRLIDPFINYAALNRQKRIDNNPNVLRRIDQQLNRDKLNLLVLGYGQTFEPPARYPETIGSPTIFSLNYRTKKADLVSLTHDIRAPEIERFKRAKGLEQRYAMKLDRAYFEGGMEVLREVMENATGFWIDYIVVLPDREIARAIDDIYGGLEVGIPAAVPVHPIYLDNERYPAVTFPKGRQKLTGVQILQYIKSVPVNNEAKMFEHNVRKAQVLRGIIDALKDNAVAPWFWYNALAFLNRQGTEDTIHFDFDPKQLLVDNIGNTIGGLIRSNSFDRGGLIEVNKEIYIHDPKSGAGGVAWVPGQRVLNRSVADDWNRGVYKDPNMAIPIGGNANAADLVTGYWPNLRFRIKQLVMN